MYAQIYVFIVQYVIFNYISMSKQSDSTSVISRNIFPWKDILDAKSGNRLKQIENFSNSGERRNTGLEPNQSPIYTDDQIALSERDGYSLLDTRAETHCICAATEAVFKLAKDSVQCVIHNITLFFLKKDIRFELTNEGRKIEEELRSRYMVQNRGVGKLIKSIWDLPKKAFNFVITTVKDFVRQVMKKFFSEVDCTHSLWDMITSGVYNTVVNFVGCVSKKIFDK